MNLTNHNHAAPFEVDNIHYPPQMTSNIHYQPQMTSHSSLHQRKLAYEKLSDMQ